LWLFCDRRKLRDYKTGGIMPVLPTTAYSQAEDALTLACALATANTADVFVPPENVTKKSFRN
jgi:hypothetical protein